MAQEVEVKFTVSGVEGSIKDLNDLVDALNNTEDATEDLQDTQKESAEETGFLQDRFNGLKDSLKKLRTDLKNGIGALRNFTKSTSVLGKVMKTTLLASGIGLVLVALTSLISYFRNSEEGSRKFKIALETLSIIVGNIADFFADLGGKMVDTFTNPREALVNFGRALKQNIINRVQGMLELLPALGKAISLAFKGQFKAAGKTAADAMGKVLLGVEDVTDKVVDFGESAVESFKNTVQAVNEAVDAATNLVDTTRLLRDEQQRLTVQNAELNQELEKQRKIAEDTTLDYETRKAALDKVNEAQIQLAQNVARQAKIEEDLLKQQIAVEGNYEKREELETQLADATAARIDAQTALNTVEQEAAKLGRELDLEEVERKRGINETLEALRIENLENEFEQARQELALSEQQAIEELRLARATEEQITQAQNEFSKKREKIAEEEAKFKMALEQQVQDANLSVASQALGAISGLLGENSKAAKAFAIAQTTIDTYMAAQKAYASQLIPGDPTSPIRASIAAGVAIASGLANVRNIVKTNPDSTAAPTASAPPAPRFNTTGAVGNTLGVIGGQNVVTPEAQVTKTYVIAEDVTSAQEASKKINDLARL